MNYLLLLLFLLSAYADSDYRDRELKRKDAPPFLISAIPSGDDIDDIEFFEKKYQDGKKTYELKYEKEDQEVSVTFSENGEFLEKEEDIKFESLSSEVRKEIESHLQKKYPGHKIHEVEIRTDREKKQFIDVEIVHKKTAGYIELSFTLSGQYVSEEIESAPQIETLN